MPYPSPVKKGKKKIPQIEWKWESEHEEAFCQLKELLTSPPILTFPDYDKPFELHTDASAQGLCAVLYQEHDRKKCVISYAIRGLSKAEKNYAAHKLEFLALKWAIYDKYFLTTIR